MQDFYLYFDLGLHHILDWQGYDHILFVMALCGIYTIKDWKQVLILVTAFTIGHSVTLALSVLNIVQFSTKIIEFLIPVTILITAFSNIIGKRSKPKNINLKYFLALAFGFIHGMGFSNYLKSLLGKSSSIVVELLAFNVGLEVGQVLIVISTLVFAFILTSIVKIKLWDWTFFLSSAIFGIAFIMAAERLPALL
jgi:hypothetical protein